MAIRTTVIYKVFPGDTILKHISDGHYYGEVAYIVRLTDRGSDWEDVYEVNFTDGDTKKISGVQAVYVKENA